MALGTALGVLSRPIQADLPAGATDDPAPFKSEKERDEAAVNELSGVLNSYPGTGRAVTATLPLAATEVRTGAAGPGHRPLRVLPRQGARRREPLPRRRARRARPRHEAKGQLPQALEAYERMAREEGAGFEAGMGSFHRARVLALMGKKQEAAQAFAELIAASPEHARRTPRAGAALRAGGRGLQGRRRSRGRTPDEARRARWPCPGRSGRLRLGEGAGAHRPVLARPRRAAGGLQHRLLARDDRDLHHHGVRPPRVRHPGRGPCLRAGWWWAPATASSAA